jgi:antitoxin (DNA-binding transcriptional repressor) of toxin-antitoxin stability system
MNLTVSVSDFRNNLTDYLELLREGEKVVIKDARKDKTKVELTASEPSGFNWDNYLKEVKKLAGSGLFVADEVDRRKFRRNFNRRLRAAANP